MNKVVLITTDEDLIDFPPEAWATCEQIVVSAEEFDEFMQMLDAERPARALPRLTELFSGATVFDDDAILPSSLLSRKEGP